MDDLISRQAAIDAIKNYASMLWEKYHEPFPESTITEMIQELPSVTPQPKAGHWIRVEKDKLRCSECEVIHFIAQYPQGKIAWCPNCGAKMAERSEKE